MLLVSLLFHIPMLKLVRREKGKRWEINKLIGGEEHGERGKGPEKSCLKRRKRTKEIDEKTA